MKFSVIQNGKPLNPSKYQWDEKIRTFSTNESDLVLDFTGIDGLTFKTGSRCTFIIGDRCTFTTGDYCTFKTGSHCTFKTEDNCTFSTGWSCTFNTGVDCTFKTGDHCTFKTGVDCTFNTGDYCIFKTGYSCTFKTGSNCFATRYDIPGVTEIPENTTIKFNDHITAGYTVVEPTHNIVIDGKEIKMSEQSFNELKKQLVG